VLIKIREYLKLARSFNAVLTGISPVMGAIAMQQYDIVVLCLLFFIGFWGHTFGFVFNDIRDYALDKSSSGISDRPLLSGTISLRQAWAFALFALVASIALAGGLAVTTQRFLPVLILFGSASSIIIYDLISKKYPLTDFFVAFGIFLLILYGASTTVPNLAQISTLAWIVCVLGAIQVLFMQIVAGGMKDIENDFKQGARTFAIAMGVRIHDDRLVVSTRFKAIAYGIQMVNLFIVFLPFFIIWDVNNLASRQIVLWLALVCVGALMLLLSHRLLSMPYFNRMQARKLIGSHYMINFMIVPIMLMNINPWAGQLMFLPGLGFILSNIALHGTLLQPKTM
jgi:4-hydroxybenzoate polyprenyltransferase